MEKQLMINKLIIYFFGKCCNKHEINFEMYNNILETIYKNYSNCKNLNECFNMCKLELL